MEYKIVFFNHQLKYVSDFLSFPKNIYSEKYLTQNYNTEKSILDGTHPLNNYVKQQKVLVYNQTNSVCARAIFTQNYSHKKILYLGHFESINDWNCAKLIFDEAIKYAIKNKLKKIIGPVDTSFWNKYRLKINSFKDIPYFGEPYNKKYYLKLFRHAGFIESERWFSHNFSKIPLNFFLKNKFSKRFKNFNKLNLKFIKINSKNKINFFNDLYYLIDTLYSDFPIFHKISLKDFIKLFLVYFDIADKSLIKIAYFNNKPVGFISCLPDYQNLYSRNPSFINKIKIFLTKKIAKKYVILYLGAKPEKPGLGKALVGSILKTVFIRRASITGALMRQSIITNKYAAENISSKTSYILLEKKIK